MLVWGGGRGVGGSSQWQSTHAVRALGPCSAAWRCSVSQPYTAQGPVPLLPPDLRQGLLLQAGRLAHEVVPELQRALARLPPVFPLRLQVGVEGGQGVEAGGERRVGLAHRLGLGFVEGALLLRHGQGPAERRKGSGRGSTGRAGEGGGGVCLGAQKCVYQGWPGQIIAMVHFVLSHGGRGGGPSPCGVRPFECLPWGGGGGGVARMAMPMTNTTAGRRVGEGRPRMRREVARPRA